ACAWLRCTCSGRIVSTARKAGSCWSGRVRTSARLVTACVATVCLAMAWPSCQSQGSPTSTMLACAVMPGWLNSRAISSGPMPAASPSVKAMTGVICLLMNSVQFDVLFCDQVAVAFVFSGVKLRKLGLRHGSQVGANGPQAGLGFGHGQHFGDFGINTLLHRFGCGGWHVNAVPGAHLHAVQTGLGHGRHIGQLRVALGTGHGQSLDAAVLDLP